MGLKVLIAEPHDVLLTGLRAIFEKDARVSCIYEATNEKDLQAQLAKILLDLVVVDQSLITKFAILPRKRFVVLADKPSLALLKATFQHEGRGYLSTNASAELLRTMLCPANASFFIEPTLVPWILEQIFSPEESLLQEELLTPREKEIVSLLREGYNHPAIAKHLGIAETTLRTHMKNIAKKCEMKTPYSKLTFLHTSEKN
jgi:DNA-binding NarL/FixJ family response regulator